MTGETEQREDQASRGSIGSMIALLLGMRQKLKYQDMKNFCLWFLAPRRAHSELCNQSGGEKHGQKGKQDWCFNKCIIP